MQNLCQTLKSFWLDSSVFVSQKQPKNTKFSYFLPLKEILVATFGKECALTSRKYVSNPDISIPNLSDKLNFFFGHTSLFWLWKSSLKI